MKQSQIEFLATLQTEIASSYSNTLTSVRKAQTGLRINHLQNILLVYNFGGTVKAQWIADVKKQPLTTAINGLKNCILFGYLYKSGKGDYTLTDKGRTIAEVFTASFRPHVERIYKMMEEDIRRRL